MNERGLRIKINPIDDACDLKLNECNHKYQYIATERIPTDDWNYGERENKEEIIVYCPLCHTHNRMSKEEWTTYNKPLKNKGNLIHTFNKDKTCTFTCESPHANWINVDKLIFDMLNGNRDKKMIKFWKEDFKYIKRTGWSTSDGYEFQYHFSVKGESFNYLFNKYGLEYPNMEVHVFSGNSATVTTRNNDNKKSDVADIDEGDIEELMSILREDIEMDQHCWEEYRCDSEYYMWDDRWEK